MKNQIVSSVRFDKEGVMPVKLELKISGEPVVEEAYAKMPKAPPPAPTPTPPVSSDLADSLGRVEAMVEDGFAECATRHEQMTLANSILFKRVEELGARSDALLAGLNTALDLLKVLQPAGTPFPPTSACPDAGRGAFGSLGCRHEACCRQRTGSAGRHRGPAAHPGADDQEGVQGLFRSALLVLAGCQGQQLRPRSEGLRPRLRHDEVH